MKSKMYKIELIPREDGEHINIESDFVFKNGDFIYRKNVGLLELDDRMFEINSNSKGIKEISYWYTIQ